MSAELAQLEAQLLGAILDAEGPALRSNAGALLASAGLASGDLSDPKIRVAWGLVERQVLRRRPVDAATVFAAGLALKAFTAEQREWLRGLQLGNELDRERFSEVVDHVRTVRQSQSLLAELLRHAEALRAGTAHVRDVVPALEDQLRKLHVSDAVDTTGADDVADLALAWEEQEAGKGSPLRVTTGFPILDQEIGGYYANLNIVAGLPSVGKSAFLATSIDRLLLAGHRVGLFGLEDGTRWAVKRVIARELGLKMRLIGTMRRDAAMAERFQNLAADLHRRYGALTCYRYGGIRTPELIRRGSAWILNRGVQIILVDHGGEVNHVGENDSDERRDRVGATFAAMRDCATRYEVPWVAASHTNRASDDLEERPPRLSELAESSKLEKAARVVLGLWRRQSERDAMRLTVLKATEDATGATFRFPRHTEAGMLDFDAGEVISLEAERRDEARRKREARESERAAAAAEKAAQKRGAAGEQLPLGGAA